MKKIDAKYHTDGYEIVNSKTGVTIPFDEPLFLFRGRDRLATIVLQFYEWLCRADGCSAGQIEGIGEAFVKFLQFKRTHADKMKQPGSTMFKKGE